MIGNQNPQGSDLRAGAKVPSHPCEPGPSNKESYAFASARSDANGIRAVEVDTSALRQARQRRAGRFLKGPISMRDIAVAARLPGKALAVYVALHHQTALTRRAAVKLPSPLLRELGVDKDTKARAMRQLEAAGLISVRRHKGRSPVIELRSTNVKPECA